MDRKGPAEGLRCCRGVAPHLFERHIAEDQRDAVDGLTGVKDDEHRGDVVEAHIGVDPDAHGGSIEPFQLRGPFDRQIEGERGACGMRGHGRIHFGLQRTERRIEQVFPRAAGKRGPAHGALERT